MSTTSFKVVNKVSGNVGYTGSLQDCKKYWLDNKLHNWKRYVIVRA